MIVKNEETGESFQLLKEDENKAVIVDDEGRFEFTYFSHSSILAMILTQPKKFRVEEEGREAM